MKTEQLEKTMAEEEERFVAIFAILFHFNIITDIDMKYMSVNKNSMKITDKFIADIKKTASEITAKGDALAIAGIDSQAVLMAHMVLVDLIGEEKLNAHCSVNPISDSMVDFIVRKKAK